MKHIKSFYEANDIKIMSSEAIERIITEFNNISTQLDKSAIKCTTISKDVSNYTSKNNKNNNQIDDAFVKIETLKSLLKEANNLIQEINDNLLNYSKEGEKYLY